jgi:hypothetical protein
MSEVAGDLPSSHGSDYSEFPNSPTRQLFPRIEPSGIPGWFELATVPLSEHSAEVLAEFDLRCLDDSLES